MVTYSVNLTWLCIDGSMHADIFLAGAVAMVNHNFGDPLIMTFHSRGARAKLSQPTPEPAQAFMGP